MGFEEFGNPEVQCCWVDDGKRCQAVPTAYLWLSGVVVADGQPLPKAESSTCYEHSRHLSAVGLR